MMHFVYPFNFEICISGFLNICQNYESFIISAKKIYDAYLWNHIGSQLSPDHPIPHMKQEIMAQIIFLNLFLIV